MKRIKGFRDFVVNEDSTAREVSVKLLLAMGKVREVPYEFFLETVYESYQISLDSRGWTIRSGAFVRPIWFDLRIEEEEEVWLFTLKENETVLVDEQGRFVANAQESFSSPATPMTVECDAALPPTEVAQFFETSGIEIKGELRKALDRMGRTRSLFRR